MTSPDQITDPTADRYAPTAWGGLADEEIPMPSGQLCRVRKLDFADVMASGLLDKLNTLQGVVEKGIRKSEGQPPIDALRMMKDRRTAVQFADVLNQVTVLCVTAPKVEMPPESNDDRMYGIVYADTVGMMDKMEIFAYAMGDMAAMESFRGKSGKSA